MIMADIRTQLPDGKVDTIPTKDWETVRTLQTRAMAELETKGIPLKDGQWPLHTKFARSRKNENQVIVTVPSTEPGMPATRFALTLSKGEALNHSFVVGPLSRDKPEQPVLYALQHNADTFFGKQNKYIYTVKEENGRNTRVKYAIPDPEAVKQHGAEALVYKTDRENNDRVPDIGIRVGNAHVTTVPDKRDVTRNFMLYAGPDLLKPLPKEKIFSIAQQVCAIVKEHNEKGVIFNDLKPENFGYREGKVLPIDDGALTEAGIKQLTVVNTAGYVAPEIAAADNKNRKLYAQGEKDSKKYQAFVPNEKSDIYSVGKTIIVLTDQLLANKSNLTQQERENYNILHKLAKMMTSNSPEKRVNHAVTSQWLNNDHRELVIYFIKGFKYLRTKDEQDKEDQKIKTIFQAIADAPNKISSEQSKALIVLLEHHPQVMDDASQPWKKLLDPTHGPALAQAITSAEQQIDLHSPKKGMFTTDPGQPAKVAEAKKALKELLNIDMMKEPALQISSIQQKLSESNQLAIEQAAMSKRSILGEIFDFFARVANAIFPSKNPLPKEAVAAENPNINTTNSQTPVVSVESCQSNNTHHMKPLEIRTEHEHKHANGNTNSKANELLNKWDIKRGEENERYSQMLEHDCATVKHPVVTAHHKSLQSVKSAPSEVVNPLHH